ncbi:hypothetical protein [Planomonospora parontospora]|jgi:hypothetical protein|uniref:hypothetical protein n=1 Tax=Planomonospora parontospora TaxID=58119 RepID=UPI00167050E4|nr:hypothetical protein [Planomonospora parontospora]GGL06864.1 hypothetical protein GCM10014719_06220 [Planomonospora parontospora subsp. antibiotica]GII14162.1 hypothetical protein Ppa05_08880 [Planomonospora parontospora subsp. antibiotica]
MRIRATAKRSGKTRTRTPLPERTLPSMPPVPRQMPRPHLPVRPTQQPRRIPGKGGR